MKATKLLKHLGLVACGIILFAGCSKQDPVEYGHPSQFQQDKPDRLTQEQEEIVQHMISNISTLAFWNEETETMYYFDTRSRDFSFGDPNPSWNFSNNDVTWIPVDGGGGILIIPFSSFGANSGGTVVAGSTVIDIAYTFCFSATDEALGLDLFDYGIALDGISVVLGIAGDFEALMEGDVDEDSEFTDFFQGYAMYIVYDDVAQGTYDILDWFENYSADADDLSDNGFSYVLDFVNLNLYFSSDGTLSVSGGEMTFSGEYFSLLDFLIEILDDDYDSLDFVFVPGFGTMGCN